MFSLKAQVYTLYINNFQFSFKNGDINIFRAITMEFIIIRQKSHFLNGSTQDGTKFLLQSEKKLAHICNSLLKFKSKALPVSINTHTSRQTEQSILFKKSTCFCPATRPSRGCQIKNLKNANIHNAFAFFLTQSDLRDYDSLFLILLYSSCYR